MSVSTLHILDRTGDSTITWDKDVPDEVELARKSFKAAKEKKMLTYSVDSRGRRTQIREFDPAAEKIVASPQLVGG